MYILITYDSLNSQRILRNKMIGYKLVIWTEMYSIMRITKYFKNSQLQTFNGRVTASWDIFFVYTSIFLNVYICVCGCGSQMSILAVIPQEPSTLLFFDTGFPPCIWGSLVRLSWLPCKSRELLASKFKLRS